MRSAALEALIAEIGGRLDAEREARGWTVTRAAQESGLSKRAVIRQRKCQVDPRLGSLMAQAQAFGWKLEIVFRPNPKIGPCE